MSMRIWLSMDLVQWRTFDELFAFDSLTLPFLMYGE
jgi:hypothetical protein